MGGTADSTVIRPCVGDNCFFVDEEVHRMKTIAFKDLDHYLGQTIRIDGFVSRIRDLKYVQFLIVRDISGEVQVTLEKNEENQKWNELVSHLTCESTVKIEGLLAYNEKVKLRHMELLPTSIEVTSYSEEELPLQYQDAHSALLDTRLNYRFLDLRRQANQLMFQVQTSLVQGMRDFVLQQGFIEIHTPKMIGAASESGSEVFKLQYFDREAYLAQSPQFYKQMAIAAGFEKVFEIAPAFRAENSNSYRHSTEFTSFDIEFSYIDSYEEVMDFEEDLLIAGLRRVKEQYGKPIKEVFGVEVTVPTKPFPRIKLADLYQALKEKYGFEMNYEDVGDMNAQSEKLASQYAMETYHHPFLFVTDYHASKRAFYHLRKHGVPQGYDLIWKGCEITTGAQREHRYAQLCQQASEKGLGEDVKFYLEFFKYGCPPHGGFALGIDRLTMLLLETGSLKETMFLFRGPDRIEP